MITTPALATAGSDRAPGAGYLDLWRGTPRELGYLLAALPVATVSFAVTLTLLSAGGGLIVLVVGLPVLAGALWSARGFARLEQVRLRWAGMPPVPEPRWRTGTTRWGRLLAPLVDWRAWLAVAHAVVAAPALALLTWTVTVTWLAIAVRGLTGWLWRGALPDGWDPAAVEITIGQWTTAQSPFWRGPGWLLLGAAFALTLPLVTRGLTWAHWGIARGLLGRYQAEDLIGQVQRLEASRSAAVATEGTALRRLERDLHDGPQQRLVRIQMDLDALGRRLDGDPEQARELLGAAQAQTREALGELRALSRGVVPPLLGDLGLVPALRALADRAAVPTTLAVEPPDAVLPPELERNVYFVVAEALANVAKHSGARTAAVLLRVVPPAPEADADPSGASAVASVLVEVSDDGHGGAAATPGHGLAGLAERVAGLGGRFEVDSPAGGPTRISALVPVLR